MAEKVLTGGGGSGSGAKPNITIFVGKQGAPIQESSYGSGVKLKDVVKDNKLEGKEVRVNGRIADKDTELKDQDTVVAVPPAVSGGRQ